MYVLTEAAHFQGASARAYEQCIVRIEVDSIVKLVPILWTE